MAEAVVSMVIEGLKDSLFKEVKFLSGVSDQIEHAQTELLLMQGFLKDADAKQGDSEVVRIWVQIIREAAYDLEDVVESFALKVVLKRGGSVKLVLKRFACILHEVVYRHKVGSEIRSITAKLSDLRSKLQGYNIQQITGTQYGDATSFERQKEQRQSYPHVIQRDVVGLEKDKEKLVSQLVKEEKGLQVVSIWGMGGSGKTTLAKQVYDHNEAIKRHFDCFAWVCVSQQCKGKEVLEDILIKLTRATKKEEIEEISKMKKEQIAERLCIIQKEKKCLVVLDDIWTPDAWSSLKPGFPIGEETKTRILLTTRKKDVAEIAGENCSVHESRMLDDKESWELFKKIAISGRDQTNSKIDAEKEEIGKEMLKHCAGLPLAITVLAGLLARKVTVEEWKKVCKNVDVYIRRGTNLDQEYKGDQEYAGALRVLALSYDELPYRLKLCFLYLGHFPEDYEIPVQRLAHLWIAEGFISSASQRHGSAEVLEDVAYTCLSELVQRYLRLENWKVKVPNVIWKMKELRHLYLPLYYEGSVKLKLATLGNLQSLVNVAGADCDLNHLAELTNLRKLFVTGGVENMEAMLKSTGITFNHLRSLSLLVECGEGIQMNMVLSCPRVYKLVLRGRIRDKSLEGLQYYQNLTKMSMRLTKLQLESLKILEKIPNLRMLGLHFGSLDMKVSEVVVSEEGYPNLEFLELHSLWGLKSWSVEKGGMPSLCRLSIGACEELSAVPEGLQHVTTLKELTIIYMYREFCRRVGEGGEDFYKIQHVPSVIITDIRED
ncbi:unnamed protein product [Malus baccata var. baccata]